MLITIELDTARPVAFDSTCWKMTQHLVNPLDVLKNDSTS